MKSLKCRLSAVLLTALLLLQSLPLSAVARSVLPGTGASSLPGDWKGSLSRVDGLDTESLRRQYFSALAEANRANFSGERWVVVELGGDTLYTLYENSAADSFTRYCESSEGQAAREKLEAAQEAFLARLDAAGVGYEKKYSYTAVNNGLALRVNSEGYKALKNMDGVSGVYFSESYAVPTVAVSNNANVYTTGIYNTTGIDYKGEGMVVAILDTGLDYTHEAFVTMPKNPAWSKQYVADRMAASSIFNAKASVDDVYYNAKVPFAYDYADDDADVLALLCPLAGHSQSKTVPAVQLPRHARCGYRGGQERLRGQQGDRGDLPRRGSGGTAGHLQGVHGQSGQRRTGRSGFH